MVSVILAGTPETDNILANETPGQYEHVTSLCPISQPNLDLLRRLRNIQPTTDTEIKADVLDAVIVAIQTITLHCRNLKYLKRITLFTDAKGDIDWFDLEEVGKMLKSNDIGLTVIGSDYGLYDSPDCPETISQNYKNWTIMANESNEGEVMSLQEAYEITQEDYAKEIRPTPVYRDYLYLGDPQHNTEFLAISINMYLRTKEVKPPSSTKWSALSQGGTHTVEKDSRYLLDVPTQQDAMDMPMDTEEKEVGKEDLEKAYKFGKSVVKISEEELEFHQYKSKKEMTILGFVPATTFPRHYLYANANIITAGSLQVAESTKALSALAYALYEKDCLALVRYVSKENGYPRIGVLRPELVVGSDEMPDTLLLQFFDIPYAEDIRDYKFKAIKDPDNVDPKGINMMEDLVNSMNLDQLGKDYLQPEDNFNPINWRFNKAIKNRALNPNAPIPDIKEAHKKQFEIAPELKEKAGNLGQQISEYYQIKKVAEKTKPKRQFQDMGETEQQVANIQDILQYANSNDMDIVSQTTNTVEEVGLITPIEDFRALLNKPSNVDMVGSATKQMTQVIMKLLEISFGNQNYSKAIRCLQALRETCTKEDAAMVYNNHARELKVWCNLSNASSPRREFWYMLKAEHLGLITNEECDDTDIIDITKQVAEQFWDEHEDDILHKKEQGEEEVVKFDADELVYNTLLNLLSLILL
ncbi:SPOC like C-terminal domain-containing protein [Gilbertella persicaria]|uniref:SPOC like C-terminal domain-containing protein n=1 Tax=Gilbertella persicaria TaxID=101096 RepID=UPI0022206144|nr:SPOC like C-terminal domain-containing protein [Gilbertella persicaria]KAI8047138.1 SPOC like C-terminal domain-containing protein [Gilbertella persicaria]